MKIGPSKGLLLQGTLIIILWQILNKQKRKVQPTTENADYSDICSALL
jgi:hypothetical protein